MTKPLLYAAVAVLLSLTSSCEKEKSMMEKTTQACNASKTVKTITNSAGIVYFNAMLMQYVVSMHQPGTYDSVDVGVVCGDLPNELQQDGTRVTVSGTFKEYDQPAPSATPAGTTYYYLEVSAIQ